MKEIEKLATKYAEYTGVINNPLNQSQLKEAFISGAKSQTMSEWVSVAEHGLPTDNSCKYFIARNGIYHNHLYRLSEVFGKHNDFEITDYLPFRLPPPPQTSK